MRSAEPVRRFASPRYPSTTETIIVNISSETPGSSLGHSQFRENTMEGGTIAARVLGAPQERRRYSRIPADQLLYLDLGNGNGGILLDVSAGGCCFRAFGPVWEKKSRFAFTIGAGRSVEGEGEVAWVDAGRRLGGLRFDSMPLASREQMLEWLSERELAPVAIERESVCERNADVLDAVESRLSSPAKKRRRELREAARTELEAAEQRKRAMEAARALDTELEGMMVSAPESGPEQDSHILSGNRQGAEVARKKTETEEAPQACSTPEGITETQLNACDTASAAMNFVSTQVDAAVNSPTDARASEAPQAHEDWKKAARLVNRAEKLSRAPDEVFVAEAAKSDSPVLDSQAETAQRADGDMSVSELMAPEAQGEEHSGLAPAWPSTPIRAHQPIPSRVDWGMWQGIAAIVLGAALAVLGVLYQQQAGRWLTYIDKHLFGSSRASVLNHP